jgi:alpha-L-rhamnosidase
MKVISLCFILFVAAVHAAPVHLRTNALNTPIGIDTPKPTFSWISDATTPNWTQSAYEILVDPDANNLREGKAATWDSGRIASSESLDIAYIGAPLKPQQRYAWKVITWDAAGKRNESAPTWFETGLMRASDWKAQWIARKDPLAEKELGAMRWVWLQGADAFHVASATPAHFRYEFQLEGTPSAASLHVLARGAFVARVNSHVTGHHDEWGAFDREEIGSLLHVGKNEIEIDIVSHRTDDPAGKSPQALAVAVRITRADGTEQRLVTDGRTSGRLSRLSDRSLWLLVSAPIGSRRFPDRTALPRTRRCCAKTSPWTRRYVRRGSPSRRSAPITRTSITSRLRRTLCSLPAGPISISVSNIKRTT